MSLSELLERASLNVLERDGDAEIGGICDDSRQVQPGDLYFCMPGSRADGHRFLPQARAAGAAAALVRDEGGGRAAREAGLPFALVPATGYAFNAACGRICAAFYRRVQAMRIIAVTGTNGKTTTAWMLRDCLAALGRSSAYLGTLGLAYDECQRKLENTTPFPAQLWKCLEEAARAGVQDMVLEASSHALLERRLAGMPIDVGVFTNLTQDHLDFHGDMRRYAEAKKLLFTEYAMAPDRPFWAVLNVADPVGAEWSAELPVPVLTFGVKDSDCYLTPTDVGLEQLDLQLPDGSKVQVPLGGSFNVENCTAVAATLRALGYEWPDVGRALGHTRAAPGRYQPVPNDHGITVLIDYAHTPDALEKLLGSVRQGAAGRLIVVFGCGGDRDRGKRPLMAAVAGRLADLSVVTSDNPRTEDPGTIIGEVLAGLPESSAYETLIDRPAAVARAVQLAAPGDVVVIAGKGHEDYQIVGTTKHHMDDRELARAALEARR